MPRSTAWAKGLLVSFVVGIGTSAMAGPMTLNPPRNPTQAFPDSSPIAPTPPMISTPDLGEPAPDYRAHSDVPDLPDGDIPEALHAGSALIETTPPRVIDSFNLERGDYIEPLYYYDPNTESSVASTSVGTAVPSPGALLLFATAGVAGVGRRRRR